MRNWNRRRIFEALHFIFGIEKFEAWDFTGIPPANMKNRNKYTGINISIIKSNYNNIFDQIVQNSQVNISLKHEKTKIISINGMKSVL